MRNAVSPELSGKLERCGNGGWAEKGVTELSNLLYLAIVDFQ